MLMRSCNESSLMTICHVTALNQVVLVIIIIINNIDLYVVIKFKHVQVFCKHVIVIHLNDAYQTCL